MDELDYRILDFLLADSREKLQAIAKRLKVSEGTIRNRLAKLEEDRLIMQYTLLLDPAKLGFKASAYVGLNVEPAQFLGVLQALSKIPEIRFLSSCTGEYPIIFEVWKKDANEMADFLDQKIRIIPGITKISPNIVVERINYGKGPLELEGKGAMEGASKK